MTVFFKRVSALAAMLLLAMGGSGRAFAAHVTDVTLSRSPLGIVFTLTEAVPSKVMKIDDHELLIALKGASLPGEMLRSISSRGMHLSTAQQTPGVTTLLLHTNRTIVSINNRWSGPQLTLSLKLKDEIRHLTSPLHKSAAEVLTPSQVLGSKERDKKADGKGKKLVVQNGFTGTVDDLLLEVKSTLCSEMVAVERILGLLNSGAWGRAEKELRVELSRQDLSRGCAEALEALLLLTLFRESDSRGEHAGQVDLPGKFNDFISRFPDSVYMPYLLSMLGQIYEGLGDHSMAEGYFKVVLEDYPGFPAAAGTLFKLGQLLRRTDRASEAVFLLARVEKLGDTLSFAQEARKEYALALYDTGDFGLSQVLFETLMAQGEEAVWKDPELLLYSGNSALRAGHRAVARKHFLAFINLFPDAQGAGMALESVGESWVDDGEPERATPFFKLVIQRYPESEAEVVASVRLAEQLQDRDEKEALYRRVIDGFPEHPLARLSMLRMAALFDESGEYIQGVEMVKKLLAAGAGGLRSEAYARMEVAVLGLFKSWLDQKDYVSLIAFYEKERRLLIKLENPDIFLLSGEAFMAAHLHGSAAEEMERAIVLSLKRVRWSGKKRLASLYLKLGRALDEGERKREAKKVLGRYLDQYPKNPGCGEASFRLGRILFEEGKTVKAELLFQKSLALEGGALSRLWLSRCRETLGDLSGASFRLEEAIALFEKEEPQPRTTLFNAIRRLGDVSMKLGRFQDAVAAYSRAEKFAAKGSSSQELRFLQADALMRGGEKKRAIALYRQVAASDDEFWAGMATERLRSMELFRRLSTMP
ncbi:MAG: tetratricopeptide repeat protein [Desulfobacterales bacterium]|nr:tetratricopeptide repeat protein [Desulfobacterales bacterium]